MRLTLRQKKILTWILLIAYVNLLAGCHRYYRAVPVDAEGVEKKEASLKKLNEEKKYFILRQGSQGYALSNVVLDQTNMTLTAEPGPLPPEHKLYLNDPGRNKFIYNRKQKQEVVLREVHIFTRDTSGIVAGQTDTFSLSDVTRIDVIEFDQKRTTNSYTVGAIAITLGAALVIALLAAALTDEPDPPPPPESSCPYISSFDGGGYTLEGEIYSASIYPSLQREDFLQLQVKPIDGRYKIKISNELQEIQHTDFADLLVVTHDPSVRIIADPQGKFHSISKEQQPVTALMNNRTDIRDLLQAKDEKSCLFKDDNGVRPAEEVLLGFKNAEKSTQGKLILSAKTSSWLNYLYGEFTKGFGSHYAKWTKQQEKRPGHELESWAAAQQIPLTVSIKTPGGWKVLQQIKTIGPLIHRDVVVPFETSQGDAVEFKLSGGYMFWELDYAAIDYSPDLDFTVAGLSPYEATNEKGENVLPQLLKADKSYLVQPNVGDETVLTYKSKKEVKGKAQAVFLHSGGYYTHIRNYKGVPKVAFLKSFEKPGSLVAFSRQKFDEAWNNIAVAKN